LAESFVAKSFFKNLASFANPACGKRNLMFASGNKIGLKKYKISTESLSTESFFKKELFIFELKKDERSFTAELGLPPLIPYINDLKNDFASNDFAICLGY